MSFHIFESVLYSVSGSRLYQHQTLNFPHSALAITTAMLKCLINLCVLLLPRCSPSPVSFCRWRWHWRQNKGTIIFRMFVGLFPVRWDRFSSLKAHPFLSTICFVTIQEMTRGKMTLQGHTVSKYIYTHFFTVMRSGWSDIQEIVMCEFHTLPLPLAFYTLIESCKVILQTEDNLEWVQNSAFSWVDTALWLFSSVFPFM